MRVNNSEMSRGETTQLGQYRRNHSSDSVIICFNKLRRTILLGQNYWIYDDGNNYTHVGD